MISVPQFLKLRSAAEATAAHVPDIRTTAIKTAFHVLQGQNPQRKAGAGETFWQFREYHESDTPSAIDWRQSGKTDRVYVREKEQYKAQSFMFWSKRNANMNFRSTDKLPTKREAASILALSLALLHTRSGEMVGYGDALRPGHSEKTLYNFEQLLLEDQNAPLPENGAQAVPRHAGLYMISDFLDPLEDIGRAFSSLSARTHSGWCIQVLDPAEIEMPYKGRVIFQSPQGQPRIVMNNAADIRDEYIARLTEHNEKLRTATEKAGWKYLLHRTDETPENTIRKIWLEHERMAVRAG